MYYFILLLFAFLSLIYVRKILFFYGGLFRLRSGTNNKKYPVSILIPARNEAENIAPCLESLIKQDYPQDRLEIIVIDDDSEDRTGEIVRGFVSQYPFIRLISLGSCPPGISPKKRALQIGVEAAEGDIIFTTDADCTVSPQWISEMITHFDKDTGMVVGFVGFDPRSERSLFHKIQSLEFIGLTMAGIGSIGAGDPIIANGANLSFRKTVFKQVGGFRGEDHVISGDDDLLLQKIDQNTDWKIRAAVSPEAFVFTEPAPDFRHFINQRIRWASKGLVYKKKSLVFFLIATYLFYLILFTSLPLAIRFFIYYPYPVIALVIKFLVDFILILKATALVQRKDLRKYFLLADFLQIPYILYVGFTGILGKFSWKGR